MVRGAKWWIDGGGGVQICTTRYLLLEVANGVLVGIRKEVENAVFDVVLLQVVHKMCSIALTSL